MNRRILIIVGVVLLLAVIGWILSPPPDPLAALDIDTELLTIKSISIDGEMVSEWPAEMDASKTYHVELIGRVRPEDETPADAPIYQPSSMILMWVPREKLLQFPWNRTYGSGTASAPLINQADSMDTAPVKQTDAMGRTGYVVRAKDRRDMPKPVAQDAPDGDRAFIGDVTTPADTGDYDLLVLTVPSSAHRIGSQHPLQHTRRWPVTLH